MTPATPYTPNAALPMLVPAQARKHITVNEALLALDALTQLAVEAADGVVPPGAPVQGERHIVGPGGQGEWSGRDGDVTIWDGVAWAFHTPQEGWTAWDRAQSQLLVHRSGGWTPVLGDTDQTLRLGVNTTADDTNRLAVSADATLLSHDGAGHRVAINRAAPGNTASIVFQTDYAASAEVGLTGSDQLAVRAFDGSVWRDAVLVDPSSGAVRMPQSGIARWPLSNLFDDGGIFCGTPQSTSSYPPAFAVPPWLKVQNGGHVAMADSFHLGSATNGGSGPANGPLAQALAERVFEPAFLPLVLGFHVARFTAGSGTAIAHDFGDGVGRYMGLFRHRTAVPVQMTYSLYLLAETEALGLRSGADLRYWIDGQETGPDPLVPADGAWHHVLIQADKLSARHVRRDLLAMSLFTAPGASVVLGFPAALAGLHDLPDTVGMIASLSEFSG